MTVVPIIIRALETVLRNLKMSEVLKNIRKNLDLYLLITSLIPVNLCYSFMFIYKCYINMDWFHMPERNEESTNIFDYILLFIFLLLYHCIKNFNILHCLCFLIPTCPSNFHTFSHDIQPATL